MVKDDKVYDQYCDHKLYHLLPPKHVLRQNLRRQRLFNPPTCSIIRYGMGLVRNKFSFFFFFSFLFFKISILFYQFILNMNC